MTIESDSLGQINDERWNGHIVIRFSRLAMYIRSLLSRQHRRRRRRHRFDWIELTSDVDVRLVTLFLSSEEIRHNYTNNSEKWPWIQIRASLSFSLSLSRLSFKTPVCYFPSLPPPPPPSAPSLSLSFLRSLIRSCARRGSTPKRPATDSVHDKNIGEHTVTDIFDVAMLMGMLNRLWHDRRRRRSYSSCWHPYSMSFRRRWRRQWKKNGTRD